MFKFVIFLNFLVAKKIFLWYDIYEFDYLFAVAKDFMKKLSL